MARKSERSSAPTDKSGAKKSARKKTVIRSQAKPHKESSARSLSKESHSDVVLRGADSQGEVGGSDIQKPGERTSLDSSRSVVETSSRYPRELRFSHRGDVFRFVTITLVVSSLIFGIGFKLGGSSDKSSVDGAITTILNSSAKQIDREILERAAIEGALKATGDEWANYFPKSSLDVLKSANSNTFTGIGVWLAKSRGGAVQITSIQENSPAATSGLLVGDQILEVNGTDVRGASFTSVVALIRGNIGKKIELLVSRNNKKVLASLSTESVSIRTVDGSQIGNSVALIEIASFSQGTALDVKESLSKLKYREGVILDLRNNPGGLIEEAVAVAELFISTGVIVSYQVNGVERLFKANNPSAIKVPVIIMINRNTASSAEIVAGAFQDRNRGVVIGERSYGKGSVQELVTLEDGSRIEITVALYLTPSGRIIEEVGITPDLSVSTNEISIKALQVLGGLASLIPQTEKQ